MKRLSQRNLQPPQRGNIPFAGWIDPSGITYPVNNETHAQWMLEHRDWLIFKGFELPSSVDIMHEISKHETANVRNILVKQGWVHVQNPHKYEVKNINIQGRLIVDAILSRQINVRDTDYPIEVYVVDSGDYVSVEKDELMENGLDNTRMQTSDMRIAILDSIHKKLGLTKEALLNMQENIVMFKHVIRFNQGESQEWIIADAYDLDKEPDLGMKFNLALIEAGLSKAGGQYYERRLTSGDTDAEYQQRVQKAAAAFQQMAGPEVKVVPEKEFGRGDRSVVYIKHKKDDDALV